MKFKQQKISHQEKKKSCRLPAKRQEYYLMFEKIPQIAISTFAVRQY